MAAVDEDALICDFAETYQIYDYRALPCVTAAALAAGLRSDSRIKMEMAGLRVKPEVFLLASCADRLGLMLWLLQSRYSRKRARKPKSILAALSGEEKESSIKKFSSAKAFEAERTRILARIEEVG